MNSLSLYSLLVPVIIALSSCAASGSGEESSEFSASPRTGLGSATLSWTAPTANTNGSPLTDLAGYKFYWGTSPGDYSNIVTIHNPGITIYVIDNLVPGNYYFVATAFNADGVESEFSNAAVKSIPRN